MKKLEMKISIIHNTISIRARTNCIFTCYMSVCVWARVYRYIFFFFLPLFQQRRDLNKQQQLSTIHVILVISFLLLLFTYFITVSVQVIRGRLVHVFPANFASSTFIDILLAETNMFISFQLNSWLQLKFAHNFFLIFV